MQKKKREKGKNTSVLCIFLRYLSPPLAPLVLARSSHVGTRWINRRGNVPTNVPFIRSDSVLSGRDISRRRDDFVKRGGEGEKMDPPVDLSGPIYSRAFVYYWTSSAEIVLVAKRVGRISS